ncbi:thioredoxin [Indivirus ILV1]|uniref:Thioredoxin n=1 Tax=Indivirus ILV1 TaxID=1977633 RepID=A0A1V0SCE7_9VIRU|nr:thioredoxin [Indivirus ILV1]
MQAWSELLKRINYTYLAVSIIIILIGLLLYYFWSKNSSSLVTQINAPVVGEKKKEPFTSDKDSQNGKGEIVLYYAMWCGFSRSFLPEWEKFELYAKDNLPNIKVTRMKCEDGNENTCSQKGIRGFPSVVLYRDGKPEVAFDKERTMQKLVEFVNEN